MEVVSEYFITLHEYGGLGTCGLTEATLNHILNLP